MSTTILLDDLLLDAQHELEELDCPRLGGAVARARTLLIERCILHHEPPVEVELEGDFEEAAPFPMALAGQ